MNATADISAVPVDMLFPTGDYRYFMNYKVSENTTLMNFTSVFSLKTSLRDTFG